MNLKKLLQFLKKDLIKKIIFVTAILIVLWFARGLVLVALVNGYPVSRVSIISELEKRGGKAVLESLIDRSLVSQEAKRQKVVISQETIKSEIEGIEKILSDQGTTLDEALAIQGQDRADIEEQIKIQKTVESMLSQRINVSEEDLQNYYKENNELLYKGQKFEDIKEEVRQSLYQGRIQEEYQKWIEELRARAKIIYFVNYSSSK